MTEPDVAWDDGRLHALTMGAFALSPEWETRYQRQKAALGHLCPLCLAPITEHARACRGCLAPWLRLRRSPYALARWIVEAAQEPQLGDTVVWGERPCPAS